MQVSFLDIFFRERNQFHEFFHEAKKNQVIFYTEILAC